MRAFAFASCVPFGRERSGVLFRAAAARRRRRRAAATRIEALLGLDGPACCATPTRRRGQRRSMRLAAATAATRGSKRFLLAGDISAEAWVKPLLQDELPAQAFGRAAAGARRDSRRWRCAARGRQVCSCFDVSEAADRRRPRALHRHAGRAARAAAGAR